MTDLGKALRAAAEATKPGRTPAERKVLQDALRGLRDAVHSLFPDHATRHSEGQTIAAAIPWVTIHPQHNTAPDPKSGYFVVYLFAEDGSRVFLNLAVGTQDAGGIGAIHARARALRDVCGVPPGAAETPSPASTKHRGTDYAAGTAFSFVYELSALPEEEALVADLTEALRRLDETYDQGLRFQDGPEPVHLFFPWVEDASGEGIVKQRKQIADEKGAAWWVSNRPIQAKQMQRIKEQLSSGIMTYAYLYARNDSWRTRMLDITTDIKDVQAESQLVATDYSPVDGRLMMKLTDFTPLPSTWSGEGLVAEKTGKSVVESVKNRPAFTYVHSLSLEGVDNHSKNSGGDDDKNSAPTPEALEEELQALHAMSGVSLTELREMHAVLNSDLPQLVLAGPPGTGKTWLARLLAQVGNQLAIPFSLVQFHPSYAYEDFVEGLRPVSENKQVVFQAQPGHLLKIAQELPAGGPDTLIIDELNRANIPSVFGELLYLLEYREQSVRLRLSGDFRLPRGLRFIATMNTADRSVRSMDAALRRRFEIFELPPSSMALNNYYATVGISSVPDLTAGFEMLNAKLEAAIDRHHTIGHSFFMAPEMTGDRLMATWHRKVRPLLEEYFFDEPHRVESEFNFSSLWPSQAL